MLVLRGVKNVSDFWVVEKIKVETLVQRTEKRIFVKKIDRRKFFD
jgi:hypothetical protein